MIPSSFYFWSLYKFDHYSQKEYVIRHFHPSDFDKARHDFDLLVAHGDTQSEFYIQETTLAEGVCNQRVIVSSVDKEDEDGED